MMIKSRRLDLKPEHQRDISQFLFPATPHFSVDCFRHNTPADLEVKAMDLLKELIGFGLFKDKLRFFTIVYDLKAHK
jgi:hypothetical protein